MIVAVTGTAAAAEAAGAAMPGLSTSRPRPFPVFLDPSLA